VILAGDVSYQKDMADRVHAWLRDESRRGVAVYIGDPGRAYLPAGNLSLLATYEIPVLAELEDTAVKTSRVFRVTPDDR
jgi:predicted nicotinamide N-methyase